MDKFIKLMSKDGDFLIKSLLEQLVRFIRTVKLKTLMFQ